MTSLPSTLRAALTAAAGAAVALGSVWLLTPYVGLVASAVLSVLASGVIAAGVGAIPGLARAPVPKPASGSSPSEQSVGADGVAAGSAPGTRLLPPESTAKAEYLAGISHEIRTPLNGILGLTQLLMKMKPTPQQREYLEMIRSSGDSLLRLINDILDHAKIRSGEIRFVDERFFLRKVVRQTAKSLAPEAHLKELELAYWVEPDVPDALVGDPNRLRQVLTNLLSNAIKFTEKGDVFLEVELEGDIPGRDEVAIRFTVSDTGMGVPVDSRQRIFESFAQGDRVGPRKYGGVGLGLTISSQLVQKMGGTITLESEEDRGSRFRFTATFQKGEPAEEPLSPDSLEGLRVLIVDDSPLYRDVLLRLMASWGIEAVAAANHAETQDLLASSERGRAPRFTLFLLDSTLSGVDAWTIAREIESRANIPGVLMTQSHECVDTTKLRAHGFLGYLSKPVAPSHLLRAIEIIRRGATVDRPEDVQTNGMDRLALGGLRVLLAEDNSVNQTVATRMLEKAGSHVTVADDGRAALEAWERGSFDFLLLDVEMPELDGIDVAMTVRRKEREEGRERIPMLALTAHARLEDRERCLAAGMDDFVSKPFQEEDLVAVMERLLRARRSRSRRPAASAPSSSAPASTPTNFDRKAALRRANGEPALLAELSGLFLEESPRTMEAIRIALSAKDARTVEKLAHRLRGSLLTLCAARGAEVAQGLEDRARAGSLTECAQTLYELEKELDQLRRDLLSYAANAG